MDNVNHTPLSIARTYFESMASKDVEKLMALVADDIVCDSPVGRLAGAPAFRGFQEGFARMINKLTLIAAFGDDKQAAIVYDSDTLPVKSAIVAEYITVKNGRIASTRVIYDATPFAEYMAKQSKHQ
jgi:ketosteroid isomerase-like protein